MAGNTVFDPTKLQSGNLADCEEQQIPLELAKKLCRIAAEECGENGYRGGIRPAISMLPRMDASPSARRGRPVKTAGPSLSLSIWRRRCSGTARRVRPRMFILSHLSCMQA